MLRHSGGTSTSGGTSSSKREVYTARLGFIWVVKEKGRGMDAEFLTTLCALYYFISALYIELLRKRNIFMGEGISWSLGLGEIPGLPLNKTCVCVSAAVVVLLLLAAVASAWIYLSM